MVGPRPSVRTLSRTIFTLSGCWRALSRRLALPKSTSILSVPAETKDLVVAISRVPGFDLGEGTSSRAVSPFPKFCSICFNFFPLYISTLPTQILGATFNRLETSVTFRINSVFPDWLFFPSRLVNVREKGS